MENLRQALKLLFLQKSPQEILGKWSKGGSADAEIDREDLRLRYSDDYRAFTLDQSDCAYQHLRNVWMHAPDNSVLHFAGRGAFENNPFVETVQEHIKAKTALGDELIERLKNI